jgi:DNA-binding CsgD family transcriptional regulator
MVSREVIAPEALERTEYYADFVRRWGVNDMLSATAIIKKQTALSLVANPNNLQRFEDIDKQLVMRLWPDINRAFHLCMKIGMAETAGAMGLAWDHARQPVLLVQQGQLVYANACAERTLRTSSVIARSAGSLRFHDEAANAALRELSRPRELRNLAGNRRNASLMVHGSDGEAWLVQMVALQQQERPGPAAWFSTDPGVFITLSPVNAAAATRTGMVESLVQFTAVEREILLGLADGRSVEQIARLSGRRTSTVRWHVRNMLEKTGLKSLSDLARFVSLLLPF